MLRRTFLKLLGLSGIAPLGLLSVRDLSRAQIVDDFDREDEIARALLYSSNEYRIVVVDRVGDHRWAPATKYHAFSNNGRAVTFYAEDVVIDRYMTVVKSKLLNPEGKIISEKLFPASIPLGPHDVLKLSYTLGWDEV